MMELNDSRWQKLKGGYKIEYDATPALRRLELDKAVWNELWENLHHQGNVGEASYAAVPHIVKICQTVAERDWNLYALVSTIEIERHRKTNPPIPSWLLKEYEHAWQDLLQLGLMDLQKTTDPILIRSILGTIAIARGNRKLGTLLVELDTSEIDELLEERLAWSDLYTS
jgi:hypothetical protein